VDGRGKTTGTRTSSRLRGKATSHAIVLQKNNGHLFILATRFIQDLPPPSTATAATSCSSPPMQSPWSAAGGGAKESMRRFTAQQQFIEGATTGGLYCERKVESGVKNSYSYSSSSSSNSSISITRMNIGSVQGGSKSACDHPSNQLTEAKKPPSRARLKPSLHLPPSPMTEPHLLLPLHHHIHFVFATRSHHSTLNPNKQHNLTTPLNFCLQVSLVQPFSSIRPKSSSEIRFQHAFVGQKCTSIFVINLLLLLLLVITTTAARQQYLRLYFILSRSFTAVNFNVVHSTQP
jgi:hypothetical protein